MARPPGPPSVSAPRKAATSSALEARVETLEKVVLSHTERIEQLETLIVQLAKALQAEAIIPS